MIIRRRCILALAFLCLAGLARPDTRALEPPDALIALAQQAPAQPEQQDEFRPISELPPQDQLPAAPLLVTAYAFVMVALFAYLVSVARRLMGVQRELERLEADMKRASRS
jgi:CcmD family protein